MAAILGLRERVIERFSSAVLWNAVGSVATQGAAFVGNLLVARLIGREAYGGYAIVTSTMLMITGIAQLAMGFTATKFVAEFCITNPARASRVLGLCQLVATFTAVVAAIVLLGAAGPLATRVLKVPVLGLQLTISAGYVLFAVMTGALQGALGGLEAFRLLAAISLVHAAAHVLLCWVGARIFGATGGVAALVLSAGVRWGLGTWALIAACRRRGLTINSRHALQERRVLIDFAIPAALSGFLSLPALWACNAILVSRGGSLTQMAYFGAAMNLKTLVLFLPTLVDGAGTALLNSERGLGNIEGYRRVFRLNLAVTTSIVGLLTLAIMLLAGWLMSLFGPSFAAGAGILRVLALAAAVQALSSTFYQLIQTQGRMWFSLLGVCLPRDSAMVALAFPLASHYGAVGLGIAQLLAWLLALVVVLVATVGPGSGWAGGRGSASVRSWAG
jgi:O-antigen/teichoic acid export membrane protein